MRVWLIKVGEIMPTSQGNQRLMRMGMLASILAKRGHDVLWWASAFHHYEKRHLFGTDTLVDQPDGYRIWYLHGPGYPRNICLQRFREYRVQARKLARLAESEPRPDVVLCAWPVPELAVTGARYAAHHNVPMVLDVRDLWPDLFYDVVPRALHPLARLALTPMRRAALETCRQAAAITGTSPAYVEWGLRHAGREPGSLDHPFLLGYSEQRPDVGALAKAREFWHSLGVGTDPTELVVCFFGSFGSFYDLATVIEAARLLDRGQRSIRFVLCGKGDREGLYQSRAAGLTNVLLPGWVDSPQIWALMDMAGVGLFPVWDNIARTTIDNVPNKIAEYLCAGLPVMLTRKGIHAEDLLTQHECGVAFTGPEGLADELCRLYDAPATRQAMSASARRLFQDCLVAEKVYGSMADHLEQVAQNG